MDTKIQDNKKDRTAVQQDMIEHGEDKKLEQMAQNFEKSRVHPPDFNTKLAQYLMDNYKFLTKKGSIYTYYPESGTWKDDGEDRIRNLLRKALLNLKNHAVNEVVSKIRDYTINNEIDFCPAVNGRYVNLKNCTFDMELMRLAQHSPNYHFLGALPVNFDINATCPNIIRFLMELTQPEAGNLISLLEEIGYILIDGNPFQKGFIHLGELAANGKSTLAELERAFIGESNTTSLTITQISDRVFLASKLFGKLANIGAELTKDAIKEENVIKALLGGDTFTADVKFKQAFDFRNRAKLVFSANILPWANTDPAWNRRWQIIEFKNRFVGDKADRFILQKLTTSGELSGLFNLMLYVRNFISVNGKFTYEDTEQLTERKYARGSGDSVKLFKLDVMEREAGNKILRSEVYSRYAAYCTERGLKTKNSSWFGRNLNMYNDIGFTDVKENDVYYYIGFRLNDVQNNAPLDGELSKTGISYIFIDYLKKLVLNKNMPILPILLAVKHFIGIQPCLTSNNENNEDLSEEEEFEGDHRRNYCEGCGRKEESYFCRVADLQDPLEYSPLSLFLCDSCENEYKELERMMTEELEFKVGVRC